MPVKVKFISEFWILAHPKEGNLARSLKFDNAGNVEGVRSEKI